MAMFQVKANGKWRDIALPFGTIEMIAAQVQRYGAKPNSEEMQFLGDLVREKWPTDFARGSHVSRQSETTPGEFHLSLDEFVVMALKSDTLKLGLLWETRKCVGFKGERREWYEEDGFVEVTILPAN